MREFLRQGAIISQQQQPFAEIVQAADGINTRADAVHQEHGETWRQFVGLMLAQLPLDSVYPEGGRLRYGAGGYQRAAELIADLRLLYQSLVAVGAWRVADASVVPVIRAAQTFGFQPGDIIVAIGDSQITTVADAERALAAARQRLWQISVKRGNRVLQLQVPG